MVANIFIFVEVLLMLYLLFNFKKLKKMYSASTSTIIVLIVLLGAFVNYEQIDTRLTMMIDIFYMLFLIYIDIQLYLYSKKQR